MIALKLHKALTSALSRMLISLRFIRTSQAGRYVSEIKRPMKIQSLENFEEFYGLKGKLDIEKFRIALSHPIIDLIRETIDYTRSYEAGLDAWLNLLSFAEQNKHSFAEKEYSEHITIIYSAILDCLDCLDRWEDYIQFWEKIFKSTNYSYTFSHSPPKRKKDINTGYYEDIEKYIIAESHGSYCVHFLYYKSNRKKIIEKKLKKLRDGKKVGNLLHARQEDLSDEEINARYEHMKAKAKYVGELEVLIKKASNRTL